MQLVALGAWIDGHHGCAHNASGHHGLDELGVVGHQQGHALARRNVQVEHGLRHALPVVPKLAVGAHLVGAYPGAFDGEHLEVWKLCGSVGDHAGEDVVGVMAHAFHLLFSGPAA